MKILKRLKWKNILIILGSFIIIIWLLSSLFSNSNENSQNHSSASNNESNPSTTKSNSNSKTSKNSEKNIKTEKEIDAKKVEEIVGKYQPFSFKLTNLTDDKVIYEKDTSNEYKFSASDTKIILLYEYLKKVKEENINLEEKVKMRSDIISVDTFVVRNSMSTKEEILHRLIKYSSNSDANYLIKYEFGGFDKLNELITKDFPNTKYHSFYSLGPWVTNTSTANDETNAMKQIYKMNSDASNKILGYFKEVTSDKQRSMNITGSLGGKIGNNGETLSWNALIKRGNKVYNFFIHFERADNNDRTFFDSPKYRKIISEIGNDIFK